MNLQDINEIWDRFEKSSAVSCTVHMGGDEITLKKPGAFPQRISGAATTPAVVQTVPDVKDMDNTSVEDDTDILIKAPLVGTFYESKAPGEEPFVKIGQQVKKGEQVAILEAMKLMNSVEAPEDGVVKSIEVKDGESVEYGQIMIRMERI